MYFREKQVCSIKHSLHPHRALPFPQLAAQALHHIVRGSGARLPVCLPKDLEQLAPAYRSLPVLDKIGEKIKFCWGEGQSPAIYIERPAAPGISEAPPIPVPWGHRLPGRFFAPFVRERGAAGPGRRNRDGSGKLIPEQRLYQRPPTEGNYLNLRDMVIENYNAVLGRREAKLAELKEETAGKARRLGKGCGDGENRPGDVHHLLELY